LLIVKEFTDYGKRKYYLLTTIPSPISKIVVSGMRYDFPKPIYHDGFGKSASLHSRNNYPIGEGIVQKMTFKMLPMKKLTEIYRRMRY